MEVVKRQPAESDQDQSVDLKLGLKHLKSVPREESFVWSIKKGVEDGILGMN